MLRMIFGICELLAGAVGGFALGYYAAKLVGLLP